MYAPAREYADGGFGFVTSSPEGAESKGPETRIVAFESRGDAQEVQWLWDSWPETDPGSNRCGSHHSQSDITSTTLHDENFTRQLCIPVPAPGSLQLPVENTVFQTGGEVLWLRDCSEMEAGSKKSRTHTLNQEICMY